MTRAFKYLLFSFCFFPAPGSAQSWEEIGEFDRELQVLYTDTVEPALYIGGNFLTFDGDTFSTIAKWNGSQLIPLGCGIDGPCGFGTPVSGGGYLRSIVRYGNDIYATGHFVYADTVVANSIARWNGTNWHAIGGGLKLDGTNGVGYKLRVFGNRLYVCGIFDSMAGVAARNLAVFDGTSWSPVHQFPSFSTGGMSNFHSMYDVAEFQGMIYVLGNFYSTEDSIFNLARWDGSKWDGFEKSFWGGPVGLSELEVFDSLLVLAGRFFVQENRPGNSVVGWNGNSWNNLNGGMNEMVYDVTPYNGYLYATGAFSLAGGVTANKVARWDGMYWCGFEDTLNHFPLSIEIFDDTVYVAGNIYNVNGDTSLNYMLKYTGHGNLSPCGSLGIDEPESDGQIKFFLYPNPASSYIKIETHKKYSGSKAAIYDITGRHVMKFQLQGNTTEIDISELTAGVYLVAIDGIRQKERLVKY